MPPANRPAPKPSKEWLPLLGVSGVGAVILSSIVAYQAFVNADALEGLRGIHIRPPTPEERTVNPGGTLHLTAMGDFATMEIPVRVDWSLVGEPLSSSLPDCTNVQQCTLHAGSAPGTVSIQAEIGSFTDTASITIAVTNPFTDELPGWADDAILSLNQLGIIRGYDNGSYGPGDPVTGGQFVTLLYRLAVHTGMTEELTSEECPPFLFPSIPADHFAFFPFCFYNRTALGSVSSNPEADLPAPREQASTFIARLYAPSILNGMGLVGERANEPYEGGPFFDDVPLGHPAFYDTRTVQVITIMTGNPNGDFGIGEGLNRAQAAVIIERLRQAIDDYNIEDFWQLGSGTANDDQEVDTTPAPAVAGVDLRVTNVLLDPTRPVFGSTFTLSFTLDNVGGADAPLTQGRLRFDRENNGSWDFDAVDLHATVAAGTSRTVSATFPTHHSSDPSHDLHAGTHKVRVCTNDPNPSFGTPVEEVSRENNCMEHVFTVAGPPQADLTVSLIAFHPDSPLFGNTFTLSFRLNNAGELNAPTTQGRYRFDRGDNRSWDFDLVDMHAGVVAGGSRTVTGIFPTHNASNPSRELPVGTHRIMVCANTPNTGGPIVEESDGNNNCGEMVFTVRE